jgi:hypothetical protein
MAITVTEIGYRERVDFSSPGCTLTVLARGSALQDEIRVAINEQTPATLEGFPKLGFNPVWQGGKVWVCDVEYGLDRATITTPTPPQSGPTPGVPEPGSTQASPSEPATETDEFDESYTFSVKLASTHITQSIKTVAKVGRKNGPWPGNRIVPPDFGRAIGVDRDGRVMGVDIGNAGSALRWTRTLTIPSLSPKYKQVLRNAVGTVNDRKFYHSPSGEVLFEGVEMTRKGLGGWHATFSFLELENWEEGDDRLVIIDPLEWPNDALVLPRKDGWDFAWVHYGTRKDTASGRTVEWPLAAYVEQVYKRTDFRKLGLTPPPPSGPTPLP